MPWFAFREPLDRCRQSFVAGLLAFRLGDPLEILPSFAGWKIFECFPRFRVFLQRGAKVVGDREWLPLFRLGSAWRLDSGFIERGCLFHVLDQRLLAGQIGQRSNASEAPHRCLFGGFVAVKNQRFFPESEGAVLFEGGHPAQHALVIEMGKLPLDRLLHVRATGMHDFAEVLQNRFGEIRRFCNIGVDSGVFGSDKTPLRWLDARLQGRQTSCRVARREDISCNSYGWHCCDRRLSAEARPRE